jgi:hypothetical protein
MNIHQTCISMLDQLSHFISEIRPSDYYREARVLNQSTVGQHVRHTIEFFLRLKQGYENGLVNYDKRAHDKLLETEKHLALDSIATIKFFIESQPVDKQLKLEVGYNPSVNTFTTINTNFLRELVYNIEHAVHHMAILKIGIREVADYISLPADFGVAYSTIRHKKSESVTF